MKRQLPGIAHGIAVSTMGNLGAPLVALISAPILAHSLGVSSRGDLAAATAPLLLAMNALTLGLPEAITYYTASRRTKRHNAMARGVVYLALLGTIGTLALLLLVPILTAQNSATSEAMSLAAFALAPSLVLSGVRAYAAGKSQWGLISCERFVSSALRLVVFLLLVSQNLLTVLTASITIAATGFAGIVVYLAMFFNGKVVEDTALRVRNRPRLLSFGLRIWVGALSGILLSRLDQVLMIPLSSSYEIGLYAVAVSISEVTLIFNSAVRDVLFSFESAKSDDLRLSRASRLSTIFTLVGATVIGISSIWLLPALFGRDFGAAIVVLEILLLAVVVGNPGSVAGAGLSARGKPELRSVALFLAFVVNIALVLFLVPAFGAVGAAAATLIGNYTAGTLCIYFLRKSFSFRIRDFYGIRIQDFYGTIRSSKQHETESSMVG